MNATSHNINNLIMGGNKFEIPIYQRKYSWSKNQVKKLFDDIINQSVKAHFTGVFFLRVTDGVIHPKTHVIDGQQRLTTIYLMLKSLFDIKDELNIKSEVLNESRYSRIFKTADEKSGEYNIKLLDIDMKDFEMLLTNMKDDIKNIDSTILRNYIFISELIKNTLKNDSNTLDEIYEKIMKLSICVIDINPNVDEDAQEIFESLNSKSELLTQGNLLKNYIFMTLKDEDISEIFTIWKQIEENSGNNIDNFMPHVIMCKINGYINHPNKYYESYKRHFTKYYKSRKDEIIDLLKYSRAYKIMTKPLDNNISRISPILKRLYELGSSSYYPIVLKIIYLYLEQKIKQEDACILLKIIETYVVRKLIAFGAYRGNHTLVWQHLTNCKINHISSNMVKEFYNSIFTKESIMELSDDIMVNSIKTNPIYKTRKIAKLILKTIEEVNNPMSILDIDSLEIEHILPQKPKNGQDDEYLKYVHNIGNLTLITKTKNKKINNESFDFKKKNDYKDSNISITKKLCKYNIFSTNDILDRSNDISNIILKVWPLKIKEVNYENKNY